jgi:hypothetical protein
MSTSLGDLNHLRDKHSTALQKNVTGALEDTSRIRTSGLRSGLETQRARTSGIPQFGSSGQSATSHFVPSIQRNTEPADVTEAVANESWHSKI